LYLLEKKLEAGVRIERLTLDFIRVLNPYTQPLTDYSSTIRPYPITAHPLHLYWQFYWQTFNNDCYSGCDAEHGRKGYLARTRIYNKPPAGLVPDDSPTQLASQVTGAGRHDGAQVVIDDHLKEVLANWSVIPLSVREAIVAIIRCAIPKDGHDEH